MRRAALGTEVVRVGTLSKALGSVGGFVAARRSVIELLVNVARPFIFTTGTTSADTAGALAAVRIVRGPEGDAPAAAAHRPHRRGGPGPPVAHRPRSCWATSRPRWPPPRTCSSSGSSCRPSGRPTVAVGSSRLRVALSAAHTDEQIERLVKALADLPAPAR